MYEIIVKHKQQIFKNLFVKYYPTNYELYYNIELEDYQKNRIDSLDYFDFCVRRYIAGQQNNLRKAFEELNDYMRNGFDKSDIIEILNRIENECITHEFYEVMHKVNITKKKVAKRLSAYENPVSSQKLSLK